MIFSLTVIYVTTQCFVQRKLLGLRKRPVPAAQYPLEDILEKYGLWVNDFYDEKNRRSKKLSYLEFAGSDPQNIEDLFSILRKRVINKFRKPGFDMMIF